MWLAEFSPALEFTFSSQHLEIYSTLYVTDFNRILTYFVELCRYPLHHSLDVKTAVNLSTVYTYNNIGQMVIEEELKGSNRVEYGKYILKDLSEYLSKNFGKGLSVTNLKQMRQFYMIYSRDQRGCRKINVNKLSPLFFQ